MEIWKDPKTMEWCQCYGNVYFHFNISCAQKHSREMNGEDITTGLDTFTILTPDYLCFLKYEGVFKKNSDQTEMLKEPFMFCVSKYFVNAVFFLF